MDLYHGRPPPPFELLPHGRREWMPAYAITLQVVTTVLLGVRLLSRFQHSGSRMGLDDIFVSIAWGLATCALSLVVLGSYRYGFDRHIWDVSPALAYKASRNAWETSILFLWNIAFTKVSILLFYRRLVRGTDKRFKYVLWSAMAFVVFYTIIITIFLCTTCFPLEATWRMLDPTYTRHYSCTSPKMQSAVALTGAGLSVVTDFYSVLLPAVVLIKLQITRRQRLGLMFIFGLGFLVVIAGIIRAIYQSRVLGDSPDKSWNAFNSFAAGIAESNLAIICACAPSLKSFLGSFFRDHFTKNSGSFGSNGYIKSNESKQASRNRERNNVVLVQQSVDVDSAPRDGEEFVLSPISPVHTKDEKGSECRYASPVSRITTIRGGAQDESLMSAEKRWAASQNAAEPPSFIFFPEDYDEARRLTQNRAGDQRPRRL